MSSAGGGQGLKTNLGAMWRCGCVREYPFAIRVGVRGPPREIFRKKGCKWCILRYFSRLRVHFPFLKNFTVCHKNAGVEGTWNGFFQRDAFAKQFFFSWSEGGFYPLKFLENGIKWCFLKPFSIDFMFCFVLVFFFGGGGALKPRNGGFGIEECFLYLERLCLIKTIRRSPLFLKKSFVWKWGVHVF